MGVKGTYKIKEIAVLIIELCAMIVISMGLCGEKVLPEFLKSALDHFEPTNRTNTMIRL